MRVGIRDQPGALHFLRRAGSEVSTPCADLEQQFVGDDVEFLLRITLHVAGAGIA